METPALCRGSILALLHDASECHRCARNGRLLTDLPVGKQRENGDIEMTRSRKRFWGLAASAGLALSLSACDRGAEPSSAIEATPAELRAIIKEAYIYGFPMVDSHRIQYSYFVEQAHPE